MIQIQLLGDSIKVMSCATTSNCVSIKDRFSTLVKQRKETELIVQCIQRAGIYSLAIGTETILKQYRSFKNQYLDKLNKLDMNYD